MLSDQFCPPPTLLDIGYLEHVLVWSWRKIVVGRAACPVVQSEFSEIAGAAAAELLLTFGAFLMALSRGCRHKLQIGYPGCMVVTNDERQILALLAAAQADDESLFGCHLRWLVQAEHQATMTIAAQTLGRILAQHGANLSRTSAPDAPPATDHDVKMAVPC